MNVNIQSMEEKIARQRAALARIFDELAKVGGQEAVDRRRSQQAELQVFFKRNP